MQSFAARGLYPTHTAIPDSGLWGPWFWWGGRDHGIIFLSFSWNPQKPILKFPRMLGGLPSPAPTSCRDRHEAANHVHLSEKVKIHLRHFSQHKTADHIHKCFHYNYIWISLIIQDKYIFTFHDFHFHCLRMRALASARDFPPPAKMLKLVSSSSAVKQCRQTRWSNNTKVVHWRALIVEPLSISSCSLFSDSIRRWRCGARYWVDSLSLEERPLSIFLWTGVIWSPWIRHSIEIF